MKIDHHRGPVVCVAISSTSEVLVSGSTDATICLWSLETYELLNLLQFNSPVINFCLSPDSVSGRGFVRSFFCRLLNNLHLFSLALRPLVPHFSVSLSDFLARPL
jgi:WD40 repeat protein